MNTEDLYRLLRTGHIQAQGIVDTVADPMLVLDESMTVQGASRAFFETFHVDRDETVGRPIQELGNGQWDIPELRRLLRDVIPKAAAVIDFEVEHDFPRLGRRSMLLTARRLYHPDNRSHLLLLTIVDVTDRNRRESERDILFGELRHRMKNLLGVARSIARQTPTKNRTAEEYRDDFLGRFGALVEAQELAFSEVPGNTLETLVERVLAPYAGDTEAVSIDAGEAVDLDSRTLMALGLILHELATNAGKFGAFSVNGGKVNVAWRVEDDGKLHLRWVESGGPPVSAPTTTGYGSTVIHAATTYSLGGHLEQKFGVDGLELEITIPLGDGAPAD